jgi:type IV secretory pathway VirB2 component (pilin)
MFSYTNSAPGDSSLVEAAGWVSNLLTGSLAISIAMLAIAWLGFVTLQGRLPWRDGLRIVLGCFILFGSSTIAAAFLQLASSNQSRVIEVPRATTAKSVAIPARPPVFDPYAGASVPNQ